MKALVVVPERREGGFEDQVHLRAREFVDTLHDLGVEVMQTDPGTLGTVEPGRFRRDLERFGPDFTMSLNFNYLLLGFARDPLFQALEDHGRPIVATWDDPLGGLANALYYIHRFRREDSPAGVVGSVLRSPRLQRLARRLLPAPEDRADTFATFRRFMRHPLMIHFTWDSGHARVMEDLELVDPERVHWYPIATYEAFRTVGERNVEEVRDLAFCGNLYPHAVRSNPISTDPVLGGLTREVCDAKVRDLQQPVWTLLRRAVEALPERDRRRHRLRFRDLAFWRLYLFVVWEAANTEVRSRLLEAAGRPVSVYGMFADPESRKLLSGNLRFEGNASHFDELPEVFASTRVNLCIGNTLIHQGMPSKLIDCLASGGFALCDPKQDLVRFLGPDVERIFFHDPDELAERIEHFLANPAERRDLTAALGDPIRRECTVRNLMEQILEAVREVS